MAALGLQQLLQQRCSPAGSLSWAVKAHKMHVLLYRWQDLSHAAGYANWLYAQTHGYDVLYIDAPGGTSGVHHSPLQKQITSFNKLCRGVNAFAGAQRYLSGILPVLGSWLYTCLHLC